MPDQPSKTPLGPADFVDMSDCAVLVTDMWDSHPCGSAAARVNELALRLNAFLMEARKRGALIIHAPSDTMKYYDDPTKPPTEPERRARQRAKDAPQAPLPTYQPAPWLELPIDDTDGGCDDFSVPPGTYPTRENPRIEIKSEDAIIHDGSVEFQLLYNLLHVDHANAQQQRVRYTRILLTGVHVNMCILNRAFGIRALVGLQAALQPLANEPYRLKQIVLVADLTDSMYNPKMPPHLNHFVGTDLVIKSIETTFHPVSLMESSWLLGGQPFHFAADKRYPRPDTPLQPRSGIYKLSCGRFPGVVALDPPRLEPPVEPRWLTGHGTDIGLVRNEAAATSWRVEEFAPNLFTFSLVSTPEYFLGADANTGKIQLQPTKEDSTAAKNWWYWEGPVVVPTPAKVGNEEVVMPILQFPMNPRLIWCDRNGGATYHYLVGDPERDTVRLVSEENAAKGLLGWRWSPV